MIDGVLRIAQPHARLWNGRRWHDVGNENHLQQMSAGRPASGPVGRKSSGRDRTLSRGGSTGLRFIRVCTSRRILNPPRKELGDSGCSANKCIRLIRGNCATVALEVRRTIPIGYRRSVVVQISARVPGRGGRRKRSSPVCVERAINWMKPFAGA